MPDAWFDRGVAFALDALARPGTKVLSHCHMGINRGPSLAYAVLLALGTDPVEALDALRRARPSPTPGTPRTPSTGGTAAAAHPTPCGTPTGAGWRPGGRPTRSTWSASSPTAPRAG